MTRRLLAALLCFAGAAAAGLLPEAGAVASTNWALSTAGSSGETQARGLPGTPAGVTVSCAGTLLNPKAVVSWGTVSLATSYSVLQSTTSSTSGFSTVATGVTALTWTSANLTSSGSYWYRVTASIGTNWTGSQSASSNSITVLLGVSCT